MTYLDVRGAARTDHLSKEAALYFDRSLTNEEMGVLRERVEKAMNPSTSIQAKKLEYRAIGDVVERIEVVVVARCENNLTAKTIAAALNAMTEHGWET